MPKIKETWSYYLLDELIADIYELNETDMLLTYKNCFQIHLFVQNTLSCT